MILEVKNILNDISFQLDSGEILGIVGGNGSGKTSVLKSIIHEHSAMSESRKIGYLSQENPLYEKMTVKNQLLLFYGINCSELRGSLKRIYEVIEEYELEEYVNVQVRNLPRDVRKKVEFISVILHRPQLVLLDEPFVGLDRSTRAFINGKLLELKKQGVSIIYTSSKLEGLDEICDRLIFLKDGKIIKDATVDRLKNMYLSGNVMRIKTSENIKPIFKKVGITSEEIKYLEYQFTYRNPEQLFNLNKEIVNAKIKIIEMKPIERTLKDIFEKEMEA